MAAAGFGAGAFRLQTGIPPRGTVERRRQLDAALSPTGNQRSELDAPALAGLAEQRRRAQGAPAGRWRCPAVSPRIARARERDEPLDRRRAPPVGSVRDR